MNASSLDRQLRLYRQLLRLLPRELVLAYGGDMSALFAHHLAATRGSVRARVVLWLRALADIVRHGAALRSLYRRRSQAGCRGSVPSGERPTMHARPRSILTATRRDVVYALRLLRKDWTFTLTATLILALAIGANTAIFSFVDTYLFRPLPFPGPERLASVVRLWEGGGVGVGQDGYTWEAMREADSQAYDFALYSRGAARVNLATGGSAENVTQQRVSAGYFATLRTPPLLGREFTASEDVPNGPAVTILSHGLWQRLFRDDPGAIGETVSLRGEPYTVVGVMPPDFRSSAQADLWVPLRPNTSGEGSGINYAMVIRLAPGVSWEQAETSIAGIGAGLLEGDYPGGRFDRLSLQPLQATDTAGLRERLQVLWISVGAVLLVACVNVSGLLLVRGNRRQREIATRLALGGGRSAITRQLLVESLVLAALGGAAGVLLAQVMVRGLEALGRGVLDTWRPVSLDARVLAVSAAATLATAVLFGLAPAIQASRVSIHDAMRVGGRGFSGQMRWGRRLVVVLEVGISVVLLVAAGLLLRTFLHFQNTDAGFDPTNLVTVSVSLQDARYDSRVEIEELFEEGIRRAEALPSTIAASVSLGVPYERQLNMGFSGIDFEVPQDPYPLINMTYVGPDYFETLATPVIQGRGITDEDRSDTTPVAVVNEAFVRRYMSDISVVDRTIGLADAERRIVGVVGNMKQAAGWGQFEPIDDIPTVYVAYSQLEDGFFGVHLWFAPAWLVRVSGDTREAVRALETELGALDPLLPLASVRLASEVHAQSIAEQRFVAVLVGSLALASVILAGLGIWGLVASTVVDQRREIGIRMALGAGPGNAISVVATPSIKLAAIGAVLGIGGSALAGNALTAMLWGVEPGDPVTYAGVGLTLLLAAAVASVLPATRAARVDPARTLQAD